MLLIKPLNFLDVPILGKATKNISVIFFSTCEIMGKSKIKTRMCFAFPDLPGASAKGNADGSSQMEAC